jgi:hypothetical protein
MQGTIKQFYIHANMMLITQSFLDTLLAPHHFPADVLPTAIFANSL